MDLQNPTSCWDSVNLCYLADLKGSTSTTDSTIIHLLASKHYFYACSDCPLLHSLPIWALIPHIRGWKEGDPCISLLQYASDWSGWAQIIKVLLFHQSILGSIERYGCAHYILWLTIPPISRNNVQQERNWSYLFRSYSIFSFDLPSQTHLFFQLKTY